MTRYLSRVGLLAAAGGLVAVALGGDAYGQNTIGGDTFAPGQADFVQSGSQVGRGPGFQFSDTFYAANGISGPDLRTQAAGAPGPTRFGAFYRGPGTVFTAQDVAPDARFTNTRITLHNMGTNAAGEMLFYPDPLAFFFESGFLDQPTKDLTNRSFVFLFPRTVPPQPPRVFGDGTGSCPLQGDPGFVFHQDLLDPAPCNRRQDNIFDTGNGYLTRNPLQLWRIMFVTWDGPDVGTSQCQAKMAELATRNGRDLEGTPKITRVREVLDLSGPDAIAGQGADQVVVPNVLPGAHGLPNPDPRNDIPGVEPQPGGQVCITVRTRRQVDSFGNVASPQNRLDGPPFVV